jgi:hypothetical protein
MLYVLADIHIHHLCQSITICYIGIDVLHPTVVIYVGVFPSSGTLGAGTLDPCTSIMSPTVDVRGSRVPAPSVSLEGKTPGYLPKHIRRSNNNIKVFVCAYNSY